MLNQLCYSSWALLNMHLSLHLCTFWFAKASSLFIWTSIVFFNGHSWPGATNVSSTCRQNNLYKLPIRLFYSPTKVQSFHTMLCAVWPAWFQTPSFYMVFALIQNCHNSLLFLPYTPQHACTCVCTHMQTTGPCCFLIRKTEAEAGRDLTDLGKHAKNHHEERDKRLILYDFER